MGSQRSGNRLPKAKAEAGEKSFNRSIRINPRKETHRWLNERIEQFLAEQALVSPEERLGLADWFAHLLMLSEGIQPAEPTVIASSYDVADILSLVQYIYEKLESGEFAQQSPKKRRKAERPVNLSETMRETIDRYIGNGFIGGEDLDEDED